MSDSAWKEAMEHYFSPFLLLLFPHVHEAIDWTKEPGFLDKELQNLHPKAKRGRRTVDKLAEVTLRRGRRALLLVHIEVQAQVDASFEWRMFEYFGRIRTRRERPVVSLAVLADANPEWRPGRYREELLGFRLEMNFPTVKLLDFEWDELDRNANPFAPLVQAHLAAKTTPYRSLKRKDLKVAVAKSLYRRGFTPAEVRALYRFVDWMVRLPQNLDIQFEREIAAFEEEHSMTYVTGIERRAIEKGRKKGREEGREEGLEKGREEGLQLARDGVVEVLESRFGAVPDEIVSAIQRVEEPDALRSLLRSALHGESFEEFREHLDAVLPR